MDDSLDFFIRSSPGHLEALHVDLTSIARGEGVNGSNTLPWHLSLAFSAAAVQASNGVAREFRRQGLGWTMTTGAGVRTQILRRLLWLSEAESESADAEDEEGDHLSPAVPCGCSDEEDSDEE